MYFVLWIHPDVLEDQSAEDDLSTLEYSHSVILVSLVKGSRPYPSAPSPYLLCFVMFLLLLLACLLLPLCLIFFLHFHFLLILHLFLHLHWFLPLLLLLASSILLWLLLQLGLCHRLLFIFQFLYDHIIFAQQSICVFYIYRSQRNTKLLGPNIELEQGQILPITLRQPARREARCCPIFFLTSFYTVDSFNYPGYIVCTPTNSVQHRWPPGFSTSDLFSLLELFTRLDHRLCTSYKTQQHQAGQILPNGGLVLSTTWQMLCLCQENVFPKFQN